MAIQKDLSISEQREALLLEKERLELEIMREQVAQQHAKKEEAERKHKTQAESLKQSALDIIRRQKMCNHKKGGKNLPGLLRGTDANYSINSHRYATGDVHVMCTRCGKEWVPGSEGYDEAINWPTDNSPSEAVIFGIPAGRK